MMARSPGGLVLAEHDLLVAGLAVRVAGPKDSAHFGALPRSARVFVDPGSATSLSPGSSSMRDA